jgi:predicted Zn finger-like uncharacterized protein
MRLICPSCGAQYEVDADLIPEAGRDVQCSACGHTWFEEPGASAAFEEGTEPVAVTEAEPEVSEEPATLADVPPPPVAPVRSPRRTVTPEIAEILREEAEREKAARLAEAQAGLERQEELFLDDIAVPVDRRVASAPVTGADDPPESDGQPPQDAGPPPGGETPRAEEPEARSEADPVAAAVTAAMAQEAEMPAEVAVAAAPAALDVPAAAIRPAEPPPVQPAPVAAPARRDRLPDIEEINSTLRPAGERSHSSADGETEAASGRGFRMGFSLVLLIAAALALIYVYAPRIIAAAPATAPVVEPYANAVDSARLWLDLRLQDLVEALGTDPEA